MRDKPSYCYECGCPLAEKGKGFVLGTGDPKTAKIALMLEAPGKDEIKFEFKPSDKRKDYATQVACDKELRLRKRDYPDLDGKLVQIGAPVVGKSGAELFQWALAGVGLTRDDLFIDNTLRCLPPKEKTGSYPKGWERDKAEACCRHYDRWNLYKPDINIISLHPAGILREPTPLSLQVSNYVKAKDFFKQGLRVLVLVGGKATKMWLGYGENVTRWQGHYDWENVELARERAVRRTEGLTAKAAKRKVKAKPPKEMDIFNVATPPKMEKKRKGRYEAIKSNIRRKGKRGAIKNDKSTQVG